MVSSNGLSDPKTSNNYLIELLRYWMEEVWRKGNTEVIDELFASDFIDHSPSGRFPDKEGYKYAVSEIYVAFPNFKAVIEDIVTDEVNEKVVVRWTGEGTHKGVFMGILPTYKKIIFSGIDIFQIKNNQVIARWGEWNESSVYKQLRF